MKSFGHYFTTTCSSLCSFKYKLQNHGGHLIHSVVIFFSLMASPNFALSQGSISVSCSIQRSRSTRSQLALCPFNAPTQIPSSSREEFLLSNNSFLFRFQLDFKIHSLASPCLIAVTVISSNLPLTTSLRIKTAIELEKAMVSRRRAIERSIVFPLFLLNEKKE